MRFPLLVLASFSLISCATSSPQRMPSLSYAEVEIKPSSSHIAAKSYISIDLPVSAFEKMRQEVEAGTHLKLKSRGEAHITVLTPQEFKVITKKIPTSQLWAHVETIKLQQTPFELLCIGKGEKSVGSDHRQTFFAVVVSEGLFQARRGIQELYEKQGGTPGSFIADNYHPHVTIGFTHGDLHSQDGVRKDPSSCVYSLESTSSN